MIKYKIMTKGNINQEFRLKNLDEIRNYFIEEINQNELMHKKHKKVCRVSSYIEHLLFYFLELLNVFLFLLLVL